MFAALLLEFLELFFDVDLDDGQVGGHQFDESNDLAGRPLEVPLRLLAFLRSFFKSHVLLHVLNHLDQMRDPTLGFIQDNVGVFIAPQ